MSSLLTPFLWTVCTFPSDTNDITVKKYNSMSHANTE